MTARDRITRRLAEAGETVLVDKVIETGLGAANALSDGIMSLFGSPPRKTVATGSDDFRPMMTGGCELVTLNQPTFPTQTSCMVTVPALAGDVRVIALKVGERLTVKALPAAFPVGKLPRDMPTYLTYRNGQCGGGAWSIREAGSTVEVSFAVTEHWAGLTHESIAQMLAAVSREFAEVMSRY